jgi:hypothetical protein
MSTTKYSVMLAAACFALTGGPAIAQTLSVVRPVSYADSRPLWELPTGDSSAHKPAEIPHHRVFLEPGEGIDIGPLAGDSVLQTVVGPALSATAGTDFEGLSMDSYYPSDNNIAVGPNHIVETVNVRFAVYDKTGAQLKIGFLRDLWTGLSGSSCGTNNGGDPGVQYDRLADRWIITQLGSLSSPYSECIAVSKTSDPTGAYNLYAYSFNTALNDYPKFGVWPTATNSAYLATYNLFYGGTGAEICAYDRAAMLAGASSPVGLCYKGLTGWSYLPADLDGPTPPLDGTPAYFVDLYSTGGALGSYKLTPNFALATATLSTFSTISVSSFSQASDVPQPGTGQLLDALSDRLMYRLAFRMFSDHEAMVVAHAVNSGGVAGMRWYELRAPVSTSGTFTTFQQGTFAPADAIHRWMGSTAMDQSGNIALGYSASGSTQYPSVRYTGRTPGDSAGTMGTEASIKDGLGSQTGADRWGDYSAMRIDPSNDCTFWYVNEYYPVSASVGWHTRIGSFSFAGCGGPPVPDFSMSANPTTVNLKSGDPGSSTITVASLNAFSAAVDLSYSGCPTNATCSVVPTPVTPSSGGSTTSTLSVQTALNTPPGSYTVTVTGTSGSLTHTTTVTVTVASDFSMSLSAASLTVRRKSSNFLNVTATAVGGSSPVTWSISGLPGKTTANFSPNPVTATGTSKLTISSNRAAPLTNNATITVTGKNGSFTHTKTFLLTITN